MRARAKLAALLAASALALAACGDDEGETTDAAGTTPLEAALLAAIEDVRDEQPAIETVDCPDDFDLAAKGAEAECELSGGGETGTVAVTSNGDGTVEYSGNFATSAFGGTGTEVSSGEG